MNRQRPGARGARHVMLLSAGLTLASAATGRAADAQLSPPEPLLRRSQGWPEAGFVEQSPLSQPATQQHTAPLERAGTGSYERSHGTAGEGVDLSARAAPRVEVRVGDHGEFERVAFEWPEPVEHEVVRHGDELIVAFSRPGRVDVSRIPDRLRQVVDAWADIGGATARITLRVLPNARVRSFNLKDGRVAIDLFGGTAAEGVAAPAPEPGPDTIRELKQALEQRDAVIETLRAQVEQLTARFEQLERTVALSSGELDQVTAGEAGPKAWVGGTPRPRSRPGTPEPNSETTTQAQDSGNTAAPARQETAQQQAPAPGQVEVDEEAVERALEFTLVQEGALLLPLGQAEFTPSFTYTRRTNDFPVFVDSGQFLGEQDARRNEFEFAAGLLVGLPFDSQLEFELPYNLVDQSNVNSVGGVAFEQSSGTGHGLGDFSVGLAKTVLRERNWLPDVVLRVNWDTGTGEREDNDVALNGGFQELSGSISLAKRQDPLVFVGGAIYEATFEKDDFDPGDALGFSIGTFLAASPSTSLSVVLNQSFIDEFKVDGQRIDGSDRVESILSLGASAILGRNVLLDGAVGVGLTDDSPDYSVSISLPIRFSTPGF
jgi:hypothetical protein